MRWSALLFLVFTVAVSAGRAQELLPLEQNRLALDRKESPDKMEKPVPKPPIGGCRFFRLSCLQGVEAGRSTLEGSPWWRNAPVADRKFYFVAAGTVGSSVLLVLATNHCRHTVALNSCLGQDGEFKTIQGLQLGEPSVMVLLSYFWKKSDQLNHFRHSEWPVLPALAATGNVVLSIIQFSKHCPSTRPFNGHACK